MATTSSIGTASRTYSTVASWLAAFTSGGWIGQAYNDSEFLVTATINFNAQATSATDFITLQTGPGQGFKDNASVQTNGLPGYNQSFGVGIRCNTAYKSAIVVAEDYVTLQYLQIKNDTAANNSTVSNNDASATHAVLDSCVIASASSGAPNVILWRSGLAINNLVVMSVAGSANGFDLSYPTGTPVLANNTIVRPSDKTAGGNGFRADSGAWRSVNNAVCGFSSFSTGGSPSGSNNASDQTISFGTSNQASLTYASQFVGTTSTSPNFIPKIGSALLDNGATDTTDIPAAIDIVGTSRPQGTAWDIGAWEFKSSGISVTVDYICAIEWGGIPRSDALVALEYGASLQRDAAAPVEFCGGLRADRLSPLEVAAGLKSDIVVPAEFAAGLRGDALSPIAALASLQSDGVAPLETAASLRADRLVPVEWGAGARVDAFAPLECAASFRADAKAPIEWTSSVIVIAADALVPIEWRAGVAADMPAPLDTLGNVRTDSAVAVEFVTGLSREALIGFDYGAGVRADWDIPAEISVSFRCDVVAPIEWSGTAAVLFDQEFALLARPRTFGLLARPNTFALVSPPRNFALLSR